MVGTPVSENPSSQLFLEWDISKKMDKQTHENVQEDFSVIHQQNVRYERLISQTRPFPFKCIGNRFPAEKQPILSISILMSVLVERLSYRSNKTLILAK